MDNDGGAGSGRIALAPAVAISDGPGARRLRGSQPALAAPIELLRAVEQVRPDVIIIDTDSPARRAGARVMISRDQPRRS